MVIRGSEQIIRKVLQINFILNIFSLIAVVLSIGAIVVAMVLGLTFVETSKEIDPSGLRNIVSWDTLLILIFVLPYFHLSIRIFGHFIRLFDAVFEGNPKKNTIQELLTSLTHYFFALYAINILGVVVAFPASDSILYFIAPNSQGLIWRVLDLVTINFFGFTPVFLGASCYVLKLVCASLWKAEAELEGTI